MMALYQRDDVFSIDIDGDELMSSWMHGSEEELAHAVVALLAGLPAPRVMVGGLGMGFTLRAALDALAGRPHAVVELVEFFSAVVEWNQGLLAHLAGHPLGDPRVVVRVADVADIVAAARDRYDGILLDVDNGPDPFTLDSNLHLYTRKGLGRLRTALAPGGVLGIWSAYDDRRFAGALDHAGFSVETQRVRARAEGGGGWHVLFLARRE